MRCTREKLPQIFPSCGLALKEITLQPQQPFLLLNHSKPGWEPKAPWAQCTARAAQQSHSTQIWDKTASAPPSQTHPSPIPAPGPWHTWAASRLSDARLLCNKVLNETELRGGDRFGCSPSLIGHSPGCLLLTLHSSRALAALGKPPGSLDRGFRCLLCEDSWQRNTRTHWMEDLPNAASFPLTCFGSQWDPEGLRHLNRQHYSPAQLEQNSKQFKLILYKGRTNCIICNANVISSFVCIFFKVCCTQMEWCFPACAQHPACFFVPLIGEDNRGTQRASKPMVIT